MSSASATKVARTSILVLDDHAIVREGVRLLLERQADFEVVAEAMSLAAALSADVRPDLILADLVLGDARGAPVVRALHDTFPSAAILVLSMVDNPAEVRQSMASGARGYVLKEAVADDLVGAIRSVLAGEDYVQPSLGAAVARGTDGANGNASARVANLSARELEVLQLVALGHTNAEIAELLSIASRTVEAHRGRLHHKLGVRSRAELVRCAVEARVVEFWNG